MPFTNGLGMMEASMDASALGLGVTPSLRHRPTTTAGQLKRGSTTASAGSRPATAAALPFLSGPFPSRPYSSTASSSTSKSFGDGDAPLVVKAPAASAGNKYLHVPNTRVGGWDGANLPAQALPAPLLPAHLDPLSASRSFSSSRRGSSVCNGPGTHSRRSSAVTVDACIVDGAPIANCGRPSVAAASVTRGPAATIASTLAVTGPTNAWSSRPGTALTATPSSSARPSTTATGSRRVSVATGDGCSSYTCRHAGTTSRLATGGSGSCTSDTSPWLTSGTHVFGQPMSSARAALTERQRQDLECAHGVLWSEPPAQRDRVSAQARVEWRLDQARRNADVQRCLALITKEDEEAKSDAGHITDNDLHKRNLQWIDSFRSDPEHHRHQLEELSRTIDAKIATARHDKEVLLSLQTHRALQASARGGADGEYAAERLKRERAASWMVVLEQAQAAQVLYRAVLDDRVRRLVVPLSLIAGVIVRLAWLLMAVASPATCTHDH